MRKEAGARNVRLDDFPSVRLRKAHDVGDLAARRLAADEDVEDVVVEEQREALTKREEFGSEWLMSRTLRLPVVLPSPTKEISSLTRCSTFKDGSSSTPETVPSYPPHVPRPDLGYKLLIFHLLTTNLIDM